MYFSPTNYLFTLISLSVTNITFSFPPGPRTQSPWSTSFSPPRILFISVDGTSAQSLKSHLLITPLSCHGNHCGSYQFPAGLPFTTALLTPTPSALGSPKCSCDPSPPFSKPSVPAPAHHEAQGVFPGIQDLPSHPPSLVTHKDHPSIHLLIPHVCTPGTVLITYIISCNPLISSKVATVPMWHRRKLNSEQLSDLLKIPQLGRESWELNLYLFGSKVLHYIS